MFTSFSTVFQSYQVDELVGCFGFSGPLRQYFSLYWAVSQREGEIGEKSKRRVKMSKQPPPAPTASAVGPCPTVIQIVGRPGPGSLPRTIAPPNHPEDDERLIMKGCVQWNSARVEKISPRAGIELDPLDQ